jgi:hypothetical protein
MARVRFITPGFFDNEQLSRCSHIARLCFAGLWTLADRMGRIEDKPRRIAGHLFPWEDANGDTMLGELAREGLIIRYAVDGKALVEIPNFGRYQHPHFREVNSSLPGRPGVAYDAKGCAISTPHADALPEARPRAQPQAQPLPDVAPPPGSAPAFPTGSAGRITDYGLRITDPIPSALAGACAPSSPDQRALDGLEDMVNGERHAPAHASPCPHLLILDLWGEILPDLPQHQPAQWTGAREVNLRKRWRETWALEHWVDTTAGLIYFRRLFSYLKGSSFLMGHAKPTQADRHPFAIELEWLVKRANWSKVVEGKYHEGTS